MESYNFFLTFSVLYNDYNIRYKTKQINNNNKKKHQKQNKTNNDVLDLNQCPSGQELVPMTEKQALKVKAVKPPNAKP